MKFAMRCWFWNSMSFLGVYLNKNKYNASMAVTSHSQAQQLLFLTFNKMKFLDIRGFQSKPHLLVHWIQGFYGTHLTSFRTTLISKTLKLSVEDVASTDSWEWLYPDPWSPWMQPQPTLIQTPQLQIYFAFSLSYIVGNLITLLTT